MSESKNDGDSSLALRRQAGLGEINERMVGLSVSPPRQRASADDPWRTETPPPTSQQQSAEHKEEEEERSPPMLASTPAIQIQQQQQPRPPPAPSSVIPRNHSSPSLVDTSPKVTRDSPSMMKKSPPPRSMMESPAPTPAASVPPQAQLTPVTNNTSGDNLFVEDGMVVSPEEVLHGESLLNHGMQQQLQPRPSNNNNNNKSGGAAPPLPSIAAAHRSKSVPSIQPILHEGDDDDSSDEQQQQPPFEIPARHHFYSFQSRQSYEEQQHHSENNSMLLRPYQPTRVGSDVVGIGGDEEQVQQIFQPSLPLEERQYSIPSIRMANHLNGSTTSYTDEEDALVGCYDYDDEDEEASLSSRGSSLYLPEEEAIVGGSRSGGGAVLKLGGVSTYPNPEPVSISSMAPAMMERRVDQQQQSHDEADDEHDDEQGDDSRRMARQKKRTKKNDKERKAYEWLRTVETDGIAEAASSRFLTGGSSRKRDSPQPPSSFRPRAEGSTSPALPASGSA